MHQKEMRGRAAGTPTELVRQGECCHLFDYAREYTLADVSISNYQMDVAWVCYPEDEGTHSARRREPVGRVVT